VRDPLSPLCTTAPHLHIHQVNRENADLFYRRHLERAFEIGDFRRTGADDGNLARILWKESQIIADDPLGDPAFVPREVAAKRTQADLMREKVEAKVKPRVDEGDTDEDSFDKLVCGYYR
jgi:hypothetical protein